MKIRRWMKVTAASAAAVPLCLYLGVIGYFMHEEQSLVYSPSHRIRPAEAAFVRGPVERVALTSEDGTKLVGRIVRHVDQGATTNASPMASPATSPAKTDAATAAASPGATATATVAAAAAGPVHARWVYLLTSNAGNATGHQLYWRVLSDTGANLFALDYRGYGDSEGTPSEDGLYHDALAGYQYLVKQQGARPSNIFVYGYSLGAAVAIELASKVPIAGLVSEGAMTSLPAVGQELYPFLPVRLIARNRFDSISRIGTVTAPKLFLHARGDHLVPFHHATELYAAAKFPKELVALDGDHGTAVRMNEAFVVERLTQFTREPGQTAAAPGTTAARPTLH